ncbi:MAG: hypothetical protein HY794_11405 [Desulfarculus sp.]|nr:hypothetical protein [Desulfarculus sp.]
MKKTLVILVALAALVAFTAPAWATEAPGPSFTVGGRMLTDIGYHNNSKELTNNKKEDVTSAFVNLGNTSYLRATFTSVDKTTGGTTKELGKILGADAVVIGTLHDLSQKKTEINARIIQTETGKITLTNWGYIYGSRTPQAGFQWESGMFGFQLALVQPGAEKVPTVASGQDLYANVPRFDLTAKFTAGGFLTQPGFGWSQLKSEGVTGGGDDTFTSWIVILPVKFAMGPFTAKAQVHHGQNNDAEWSGGRLSGLGALPLSMPYIKSNGKIEDTKQTGGFISLEYKILPVWEIAAGFGIEKLNNDAWKQATSKGGAGWKNDDYTRTAYFVALPYTVTKNFKIHPEFAYYNYGDNVKDGKDFGTEWVAGLQFQFVF